MSRTSDLSRFDPRLLEAWKRGATDPVRLPFRDSKKAVAMRHQLYRVRRAMETAGHPYFESAKRAQIRIITEHNHSVVVIEPAASEFEEAFAAAGLDIPTVPDIDFDIPLDPSEDSDES